MANSNKAIKILKKKLIMILISFSFNHSKDNYKSVNSISYAKELLNLKTINIDELKNNFKFGLDYF